MTTRKRTDKISINFEVEYEEIKWKGGWIPTTVYKYRDWHNSNHQKVLTEQSIWIPDSFDFNDPYDCNIPVSYDLLMNNEEMAREFISGIVNKKVIPDDQRETDIQEFLDEKKYNDPSFLEKHKKEMLDSSRSVMGVYTVTPVNNNILMWSHYAHEHKGFCIGYDSMKLFKFLGGGGDVLYSSEIPKISPIEEHGKQFHLQFYTKSIHWAYEVEYRLTKLNMANSPIKIPSDIITEMILGARMPLEYKQEIIEIIKSKFPHIKCYSTVPRSDKFELSIVPEDIA